MKLFSSLLFLISFCVKAQGTIEKETKQLIKVNHSIIAPKIDGIAETSVWEKQQWHPINQRWLGHEFIESDFCSIGNSHIFLKYSTAFDSLK